MDEQARLHWLTFTTGNRGALLSLDGWLDSRPSKAFFREVVQEHDTKATRHYDHDLVSRDVVNVGGEVCDGFGKLWSRQAVDCGGKLTRVDVAVDVELADVRSEMLKMRRLFRAGKVDTKIRTFSEHRSYAAGCGFTWYFGGENSPLRLRVYDRRGPMRLEFQWRPDDEDNLLAQVVLGDLASAWRGMASRIVFPLTWYAGLLDGSRMEFAQSVGELLDFERAAQVLKDQYGLTIWALTRLGFSPADISSAPTNRNHRRKVLQWLKQAENQGVDGSELRAGLRSPS